jgi:hypothetical protein
VDDRARELLDLERQIQDADLRIAGIDAALDLLEQQYPELHKLPRHGRRKDTHGGDPR